MHCKKLARELNVQPANPFPVKQPQIYKYDSYGWTMIDLQLLYTAKNHPHKSYYYEII